MKQRFVRFILFSFYPNRSLVSELIEVLSMGKTPMVWVITRKISPNRID